MDKHKELLEVCRPVLEYLRDNWNPNCSVIIANDYIKVVSDEIGLPIKYEEVHKCK